MDRRQRLILGLGALLVTVAVGGTRWPGLDPAWVRFWDNSHWTLGYAFAAALAWSGVRRAADEGLRRSRSYFAWGLSCYALGQGLWDIQVLAGWNPFPGPSDLFFMQLGLFFALGFSQPGLHLQGRRRWAFLLDLIGVAAVAMGLSLALFLSQRGSQSWTVILALAAYPTLLSAAVAAGLTAGLAQRWRLDRRFLLLLAALLAKDLLWFEWNRRTLLGTLADGVLFNYGFSYAALWLGASAAVWEPKPLREGTSENRYFLLGNLLPVLMAIVAGLIFAFALDHRSPLLLGGLALLALATAVLRQSLMVLEHDRLRAGEKRHQELMLQRAEEQRLQQLGSLAGGVAHDFNNILAVIKLQAEVLRQGPSAEGVDRIVQAADRGRDLVQRISYYARPDRGAKVQALAVEEAVREAVRLLQALLPAQVQLLVDPPSEALAVRADPVQLQQVLVNLGVNAGQALGVEGGWVRFSWKALPREEGDLGSVELTVRDNGPGIAPDLRKRIFDPFFTTKDPGQGSGLGLAIVESIVTQAGGSVHCESRLGEGASFFVTLPRMPKEMAATALKAAPAGAPIWSKPGGQILVVDDEPDLAEFIARLLSQWGWETSVATHPALALALLQTDPGRFSVMITDKTMPGMGGYELLAKAKALNPGIRTILTSGFDDTEGAPQMDAFLPKPFSPDELKEVLTKVLA